MKTIKEIKSEIENEKIEIEYNGYIIQLIEYMIKKHLKHRTANNLVIPFTHLPLRIGRDMNVCNITLKKLKKSGYTFDVITCDDEKYLIINLDDE